VCEILPHLGFQCSVKTFNDTGFGLLVLSGKKVHVVFLEKRLKFSVDKFSSTDKTGKTLKDAFQVIFKSGRRPIRLQTNKGTEFINREFQTFL
jgi:hypothetical protein